MKLSVFCSENKKSELPQLRLALDDFFIEYNTILFSGNDSLDSKMSALKQVLGSTFFYLLIPTQEDLNSQWISFVAGYSRMNTENTLFLYNEGTPPEWIKRAYTSGFFQSRE
jgi:hypothetical protein